MATRNITLGFRRFQHSKQIMFVGAVKKATAWQINNIDGEIYYPQWNSNAGFSGWAETVAEHFCISKARASVWLLNKDDIDEIDNLLTEEEVQEIASRSPFGSSASAMTSILKWKSMVPWMSFKKWCYASVLVHCAMDKHDFHRLEVINRAYAQTLPTEKIVALPRWQMLRTSEIISAIHGIDMKIAKRIEKYEQLEFVQAVDGRLDVKYWDNGTSVASALRAGVDPIFLFDRCTNGKMLPVSRKMKLAAINARSTHRVMMGFAGGHHKRACLSGGYDITYSEVHPCEELGSHIERYCDSLLVWQWACRHANWVNKSRIVYGPGGAQQRMFNHQLLQMVRDEHLPRGIKTASEYVEECVEEVVRLQMEADMGHNVALPKYKGKIKSDSRVVQLLTSDSLREEGKLLNHCVAAYFRPCLTGTCYIFHVQDGTRNGATVEVAMNPLRVQQAMNYGNVHSGVAQAIMEEALGIK